MDGKGMLKRKEFIRKAIDIFLRLFNWLIVISALLICFNYSKSIPQAVINFFFFLLPGCLFFAITGQFLRSATIASTLVLTLHLLARVKVLYFKDILTPSDFYMITDSSNWEILLRYKTAGVMVIILISMVIASFFTHRLEKRNGMRLRIGLCGILILYAVPLTAYYNDPQMNTAWLASLPNGEQGTFSNLFFSSKSVQYSPPRYLTNETVFLEKASRITQGSGETSLHPDIIVMLQESTVNPILYDLPNAQLPELKMLGSNPYTHAQGFLRTHTYGGGTWLSEFAVLAGLASRDFGPTAISVYYTVTPHLKTSLVKVLKQNGYHTVVLTPSNKSAYHAAPAYRDFGFDEILQPQDLGYPAPFTRNLWSIESNEIMNYAQKILKTRTKKPLFLLMLTLKEHGPYEETHPVRYGLENAISHPKLAGEMSDYLERIAALSDATEAFSKFLMERKAPSLFLYFGDHQPSFESGKLNYTTLIPNPMHLTQFVLRDNLIPKTKPTLDFIDIALLGSLILERAHLKPDAFFQAGIQMLKLCQGRLEDCPDHELVESYKHFIYQTLAVAG